MSSEKCGLKNSDKNHTITTSNVHQNFTFQHLRWKTKIHKIPTYDACFYKISHPPYTYHPGTIFFKISD